MHVKCLEHTKFSIDARYGYFYHHQAPCPVAGLGLEYRLILTLCLFQYCPVVEGVMVEPTPAEGWSAE